MANNKVLLTLTKLQSFVRRKNHRKATGVGAPMDRLQHSSSTVAMETVIADAEKIITKWDPKASNYAKFTSLFYEDRGEARRFLAAVSELQSTMLCFVSGDSSSISGDGVLVRAQTLMQAAMRRLEKEFYQILAANHDRLDPESLSSRSSVSTVSGDGDSTENELEVAEDSICEVENAAVVATDDLRAISETMIGAGYGKECVNVYKIMRKSIFDEGLYRLGFEPLTSSQVQRMDFDVLEIKIRSWLVASRTAVKTLFSGERKLIDNVFTGSEAIREILLAEVAGASAVNFVSFPEMVAAASMTKSSSSSKWPSPEKKIFCILDLYDALSELLSDIDLVFSYDSTSGVRRRAVAGISKLVEAARFALADFEATMQKDSSKSPVSGGGLHPLTSRAMGLIASLVDYESTLGDVLSPNNVAVPLQSPCSKMDLYLSSDTSIRLFSSPSLASLSSANEDDKDRSMTTTSVAAAKLGQLILVLLCKLDSKARMYKDVSLSYLFLANNLHHIVSIVKLSRLGAVLGEDWVAQHEAKVRQHAAQYERAAWGKVAAEVPAGEVGAGEAVERMRAFGVSFEEACAAQASAVVANEAMREDVRAAVDGMVVPAYKGFYNTWHGQMEVGTGRLSPEDVRGRLTELFGGSVRSSSNSSSESIRSIFSVRSV